MRFASKYTEADLSHWRSVLARHDRVSDAVAELGVSPRTLAENFARIGEHAGQWLRTPTRKPPGLSKNPGQYEEPEITVELPREEREPELVARLVSLTRRRVLTLLEVCEALRSAPQDVRDAIAWAQREGYHIHVEGDRVFSRLAVEAFAPATFGSAKLGRYRVAHFTDMHFGSRHCDVPALRSFLRFAVDAGCDSAICTGDVTDGHSPKLTFDQVAPGLDEQVAIGVDALRGFRLPIFAITGNHDGYHSTNTGLDTGRVTEERMRAAGIQWHHLGVCVGNVTIHGARFQLWHPHGGAGTRNAVRRVLNDRAEAQTREGTPPHVLALGHFHKHTSFTAYPERVFCTSGGTFQRKLSEFANRITREWDIGGSIISFTVRADGTPCEFAAEFWGAAS